MTCEHYHANVCWAVVGGAMCHCDGDQTHCDLYPSISAENTRLKRKVQNLLNERTAILAANEGHRKTYFGDIGQIIDTLMADAAEKRKSACGDGVFFWDGYMAALRKIKEEESK